jgi:hypothetical protein
MNSHSKVVRRGTACRSHVLCAVGLSLCSFMSAADDRVAADLRGPAWVVQPSTKPAASARRLDARFLPDPTPAPSAANPSHPDFEFRNVDGPAARLARVRSLPLMTLWQGRRTQVYLGIDQKGLAGLHFRQLRGSGDTGGPWRSTAPSSRDSPVRISPAVPRTVNP